MSALVAFLKELMQFQGLRQGQGSGPSLQFKNFQSGYFWQHLGILEILLPAVQE